MCAHDVSISKRYEQRTTGYYVAKGDEQKTKKNKAKDSFSDKTVNHNKISSHKMA